MKAVVRSQHIDIMKGFAILLVILGHRFMTNTVEGVQHPATVIIYSFHMAFFFFISGYVNRKTRQLERKDVIEFLANKLRTLILPFMVWTLINFMSQGGGSSMAGYFVALNFYPVTGYWFLPLLFIFFCIFLLIYKNVKLGAIFIVVFILLGLLFKQVYPIWYAGYWAAFMLGDCMADSSFEKKMTSNLIFGLSSLFLVTCWCIYPINNSGYGKMVNLSLSFIIGLNSCVFFYNLFKVIKMPKLMNAYFSEMGKYSLVLYLIPILIIPHDVVISSLYLSSTAINILILFVAVVHSLVSYFIGRVVFEIPYLRLILFGKK